MATRKRTKKATKAAKTFLGYTVEELKTLSVYELREINKIIEEETGVKHYRYAHFFKKVDLITYIASSKTVKKTMRDERSAALSKSLEGTALNARIAKKKQMIKSLQIRLKAIGKTNSKAKMNRAKEVKEKIKEIEQEIVAMRA